MCPLGYDVHSEWKQLLRYLLQVFAEAAEVTTPPLGVHGRLSSPALNRFTQQAGKWILVWCCKIRPHINLRVYYWRISIRVTTPNRKCHHYDKSFVIGHNVSCHQFDNFWCSQWQKVRWENIPISVYQRNHQEYLYKLILIQGDHFKILMRTYLGFCRKPSSVCGCRNWTLEIGDEPWDRPSLGSKRLDLAAGRHGGR